MGIIFCCQDEQEKELQEEISSLNMHWQEKEKKQQQKS